MLYVERPEKLHESAAGVRERERQRARLAAEEACQPRSRPLVCGQRVERLVIKEREQFGLGGRGGARSRIGHRHDLCPPDFLRSRLQPPREPLPGDGELLVGPRHVHHLRAVVQPTVADHPGAHGEAAAVLGPHLELHRPLRSARLRPEPLEHLAPLRNLDERSPAVVAGADQARVVGAWLDGGRGRDERERPLDAVSLGPRIEHLDHLFGLHRRHVARGGNLEHRPIDARRQLRRGDGLAGGGVGDELFREHGLARGPRVGVRGIDLGRPGTAGLVAAKWHGAWHRPGEAAAIHLGRLHEPRDRERACGSLRHAVERGRVDRDRDGRGLARGVDRLPGVGRHRGLDIGVAHAHALDGTSRLATGIGDVCRDGEGEHGQRVLGHAAVGLRRKGNREPAVGITDGSAPRDPLGTRIERQPGEAPAAPHRPADLPLDPPGNLRSRHRQAGVGRGRAGERHGAAEWHGLCGLRKLDLELRPLVLLHPHAHAPRARLRPRRLRLDRPLAGEPAGRDRECAMKRAVARRRVSRLRHLAAVRIAEQDIDGDVRRRGILRPGLIHTADDALVVHDLPRPVDAAVGDEHDGAVLVEPMLLPDVRLVGRCFVRRAVERRGGHDHRVVSRLGQLQRKPAILVGRRGAVFLEHLPVLGVVPRADIRLHGRPRHRLARGDVHDVPGSALLDDDRQPRHAHERRRHDVVGAAEVGACARDHEVAPWLEPLRIEHADGHVLVPLPVVGRGRQIDGLLPHRGQLQDRGAILVVEPVELLAGPQPLQPVGLHEPQVHLRQVAIAHADRGPGCRPRPLGREREILGFDLGYQVAAQHRAGGVRLCIDHAGSERPCRAEIPLAAGALGDVIRGQRRRLMVAGPGGEGLERLPLPRGQRRGAVVGDGRAASPQNPVEIGGEERRLVGVGLVKRDELAIEPQRVEHGRVRVGHCRVGFGLPGQKLIERAQGRARRHELECVFGIDEAPLPRRGELDCIADDHVPDGGPIRIGLGSLLDEHRPVGHGERLEELSLGAAGRADRGGKPAANLGHDRRQVPLGEFRELGGVGPVLRRWHGTWCPLLISPAVRLKVAPGPVGADRLEHAPRLGGCLFDRGGEADHPLRVVAGAVAGLGEDPSGDGPGGLGPGLVLNGRLFDARERFEGRLRLALVECLLHADPGCGPWAGGRLGTLTRAVHHGDSSEDHKADQEPGGRQPPRREEHDAFLQRLSMAPSSRRPLIQRPPRRNRYKHERRGGESVYRRRLFQPRATRLCSSSTMMAGACRAAVSASIQVNDMIVSRSPGLPRWAVAPLSSITAEPGGP